MRTELWYWSDNNPRLIFWERKSLSQCIGLQSVSVLPQNWQWTRRVSLTDPEYNDRKNNALEGIVTTDSTNHTAWLQRNNLLTSLTISLKEMANILQWQPQINLVGSLYWSHLQPHDEVGRIDQHRHLMLLLLWFSRRRNADKIYNLSSSLKFVSLIWRKNVSCG